MPDVLEPPSQPSAPLALPQRKPRHLFTRDNAREYALKGNHARWSQPKPLPLPPAALPRIADSPTDDYTQERIGRVRKQLNAIDAKLLDEDEPQQIERLSRAACALSMELRKLCGIPDPGSLRPSKGQTAKPYTAAPVPSVPAEPGPVQPAPAAPPSPAPDPLPGNVTP